MVNEGTSICGICRICGITIYVATQVVHVVHAVDVVYAAYLMYAVDVVYAKHVVYVIYAIYVVYAVRSMDVQARLENDGCPNSSALGKENLRSAQRISSAEKTVSYEVLNDSLSTSWHSSAGSHIASASQPPPR